MRKTPLYSGIFYLILGSLFTFIAIQSVQLQEGWGVFTYFVVLIATFDIGTGIRLIFFHFKIQKNSQNKK